MVLSIQGSIKHAKFWVRLEILLEDLQFSLIITGTTHSNTVEGSSSSQYVTKTNLL